MTRQEMQLKRIEACRGALLGHAVQDSDARRRIPLRAGEFLPAFGNGPFARDAAAIRNSQAYWTQGFKNQVIAFPNGRFNSRLTHSGRQVAPIAAFIARVLGLNAELCEAAGLGHDIGHTPYGHTGETQLWILTGRKFRHNKFSVVLAQELECLNLCHQTLVTMLNHSRGSGPDTVDPTLSEEANLVALVDKMYMLYDLVDVLLYGKVDPDMVKVATDIVSMLGANLEEQLTTWVAALCAESAEKGHISFSDCPEASIVSALKKAMYPIYYRIEETRFSIGSAYTLYEALTEGLAGTDIDPSVVFAILTDQETMNLLRKDVPIGLKELMETTVRPYLPRLPGVRHDQPNLNW